MKSKKSTKLMPTSSNTYILEADKCIFKTIEVEKDSTYYLFDLNDQKTSANLTFNVKSGVNLTFYILSVNNALTLFVSIISAGVVEILAVSENTKPFIS